MYRSAVAFRLCFDRYALFDRADDDRRTGQPKVDERQPRFGSRPERALGFAKELSQPGHRFALSRPPAERRLGHRTLSSQRIGALALLDADARRPTPEAI